jgi:hypothetical protein
MILNSSLKYLTNYQKKRKRSINLGSQKLKRYIMNVVIFDIETAIIYSVVLFWCGNLDKPVTTLYSVFIKVVTGFHYDSSKGR